MKRFYLKDQTAETAGLTPCDYAAHAMRAEVNDRNHSDDVNFQPLHVTVMDVFISFAALTINENKLSLIVQAMHYGTVDLPTIYDAINLLNKKRYLRKCRMVGGRTGYELAYL